MNKFETLLETEFKKLEEAGYSMRSGDGQANVTGNTTNQTQGNPLNTPTNQQNNQAQAQPTAGQQDVMNQQGNPGQLAIDVAKAFSTTDKGAIGDFVNKLNMELKKNPNPKTNRLSDLSQFDVDEQQVAGATNYNV